MTMMQLKTRRIRNSKKNPNKFELEEQEMKRLSEQKGENGAKVKICAHSESFVGADAQMRIKLQKASKMA